MSTHSTSRAFTAQCCGSTRALSTSEAIVVATVVVDLVPAADCQHVSDRGVERVGNSGVHRPVMHLWREHTLLPGPAPLGHLLMFRTIGSEKENGHRRIFWIGARVCEAVLRRLRIAQDKREKKEERRKTKEEGRNDGAPSRLFHARIRTLRAHLARAFRLDVLPVVAQAGAARIGGVQTLEELAFPLSVSRDMRDPPSDRDAHLQLQPIVSHFVSLVSGIIHSGCGQKRTGSEDWGVHVSINLLQFAGRGSGKMLPWEKRVRARAAEQASK
eukprot:2488415-Rhodomonas_salina.1